MSRYSESERFLERARKSMPLGSQTYSKSYTQFPFGASPYFIERGEGSYVWDIDGNRYLDMINALAAVNLGYCDPEVDRAVREQLGRGTIFSLPCSLEVEVAELIIDMVPCAEMVRFGKNGSDATTGAVRLARGWTGREKIAACGYHGWHDWYIGTTTRDLGVHKETARDTLVFEYNDIGSLERLFERHEGSIAGVIMEPMNVHFPHPGFLEGVRELCSAHGSLLIFDETVTGFRLARGGAQELFGVTPDLATFGKGIANGFPLSVLAGKRELMKILEEIFFSFTYGGEALSLAAARTVLVKLRDEDVLAEIASIGQQLQSGVRRLIDGHETAEVLGVAGHPMWSFLLFKSDAKYSDLEYKTLFMQECMKRGVLSYGAHNLSYSFKAQQLEELLRCYDEVFEFLARTRNEGSLRERLECEVLEPLFKVRQAR